jgi:hypothetical protein
MREITVELITAEHLQPSTNQLRASWNKNKEQSLQT